MILALSGTTKISYNELAVPVKSGRIFIYVLAAVGPASKSTSDTGSASCGSQ